MIKAYKVTPKGPNLCINNINQFKLHEYVEYFFITYLRIWN